MLLCGFSDEKDMSLMYISYQIEKYHNKHCFVYSNISFLKWMVYLQRMNAHIQKDKDIGCNK